MRCFLKITIKCQSQSQSAQNKLKAPISKITKRPYQILEHPYQNQSFQNNFKGSILDLKAQIWFKVPIGKMECKGPNGSERGDVPVTQCHGINYPISICAYTRPSHERNGSRNMKYKSKRRCSG